MKTSDIRVGGRDLLNEIVEGVYAVTSDYAIYRTGDQIRLYCDDDHLQPEDRIFHQRYMKIAPLVSESYAMMPRKLWQAESIRRQLARGISQAVQGDEKKSIEIINSAIDRLRRRQKINGQFQYHIGAISLLFSILSVLVLTWTLNVRNQSEIFEEILVYLIVAFVGALGGYLSLATGIRRLVIDPESGIFLNGFAGATRVLIAVTASIFAYFAVRSDIILAPLNSPDSSFGVLCIAFLAGFSEKFVPNILEKFEKSVLTDKAGDKP